MVDLSAGRRELIFVGLLKYYVLAWLIVPVKLRPKSDKLTPKVLEAVKNGRSYRWIARDLGISKNTVGDIVKRSREK